MLRWVVKGLILLVLTLMLRADIWITWPLWQRFRDYFISAEGRVVDSSLPQKTTTSEGQSYALFFALVAHDRLMFDKLLTWTQNNLAAGDLAARLPAWSWGKNDQNQWTVLDKNSASDADLWIAYDLLEAGRLWNHTYFTKLGMSLLQRIVEEETADIPGLGRMLLPGRTGFTHDDNWRLNPSYLPLQLLQRCAKLQDGLQGLVNNSQRLLMETSPRGFAPDWVVWQNPTGWSADAQHPNLGSYNAIRVYLWAGMLANHDSLKQHFMPMAKLTQQQGAPPEQINTLTGRFTGQGSLGFSAALLPLMASSPGLEAQRARVYQSPLHTDKYYTAVLRLFGEGWDKQYFRFDSEGKVLPYWGFQGF